MKQMKLFAAVTCLAGLLFAGNVLAADTANLTVTATVDATCKITGGTLDFGTLDPTSGNPATVTNATAAQVTCTNGTSYTITLENGFSWQTYNEYWRVWIDYNRNGTFEEPGEIAYSGILPAPPLGSPGGSKTGTIIVPATADEGCSN